MLTEHIWPSEGRPTQHLSSELKQCTLYCFLASRHHSLKQELFDRNNVFSSATHALKEWVSIFPEIVIDPVAVEIASSILSIVVVCVLGILTVLHPTMSMSMSTMSTMSMSIRLRFM